MLQFVAWSSFGFALLLQGSSFYFDQQVIEGSMLMGGMSMVFAELVLVISLGVFKGGQDKAKARMIRSRSKEKNLKVGYDGLPYGPKNYRKLRTLHPIYYGWIMFLLLILSNTQFVTFIGFAVSLVLPHWMPLWVRSDVAILTFNLVPDLTSTGISGWDTLWAWWWVSIALIDWVMMYTTVRTLGLAGWRLSLIMSLCAFLFWGMCLHYFLDSPHFNMISVIASGCLVYQTRTYTSFPEQNGSREWEAFRGATWLMEACEDYFGLQLLVSPKTKAIAMEIGRKPVVGEGANPYEAIMMGFHPHGIFPTTQVWFFTYYLWVVNIV